ncbi:MAG: ABC transporter substrate-binding protein, partial [Tateyamaria sp.]|nr:ABC transporter substrate-binding protein [Tateyamaria sp.]
MIAILIAVIAGAAYIFLKQSKDDSETKSAENEIKIGVILGFTGPIESLTPAMANGAELAIKEVSDSGLLLNGATVVSTRADGTCIDSAAAITAAERLITAEKIDGIMGSDCSGVTGAILSNVALANEMVMISPAATSPGLSVT